MSEPADARDVEALAAFALDAAVRAGADDAWVIASESRGSEVAYRDGAIEKVEHGASRGVSLRLYVQGRYGVYRSSDVRHAPLREFVAQAVAITRALEVDPHRVIPDASLFEGRADVDLQLFDPALRLSGEERLDACRAAHDAARGHERVVSVTARSSDSSSRSAQLSSNGFAAVSQGSFGSVSASVTLQDEGDARPAASYWGGARHREDLPDPSAIGARALAEAALRLGAHQGVSARTTMVVDPRAAGRLVGRILGPANAGAFSQERSFWRGKLGERVLSERLTLCDDPLRVRGFGSRLFDSEGIAAKPRDVITGGALQELFVDTYHGRKIGMAPTTAGASNLVMELGDRDRDALIRDVAEGYLVTSWLGGNADSTTGDFSLGIRGHEIRRGEIGRAVQQMNVTGNLLALFARLTSIGNDPHEYARHLLPTLVFEDVEFGGA